MQKAAWMGCWALLLMPFTGCGIGSAPPASGQAGAVAQSSLPTGVNIDPNYSLGTPGSNQPDISPPTFNLNMWLSTQSKAQNPNALPGIYRADGSRFNNRGPVVPDPRSCDNCSWTAAAPWESIARIDYAINTWHANFIHLSLESYASATAGQSPNATLPRVSWQSVLFDPTYLQSLVGIVNHIGHQNGVYVLLTLYKDQSLSTEGKQLPTLDNPTDPNNPGTQCSSLAAVGVATTTCVWKKLAQTFAAYPYVLFGLDAEPVGAGDGSDDALVLSRYSAVAQTIRNVESAAATPPHVLVLSGTQNYGRSLAYYAQTVAGSPIYHSPNVVNGNNIAYQTRPFNATADFNALFMDAAQYVPVIVGDFGPLGGSAMTLTDSQNLFALALQNNWPVTARALAPNCDPSINMLAYPAGPPPPNVCDGSSDPSLNITDWGHSFLLNVLFANP